MSDNDDPEKRIKDNTNRELKPQNARRRGLAPSGMMGNQLRGIQRDSLLDSRTPERHFDQSQADLVKDPQEHSKNLPYAERTHDPEVDAESSKTHKLIDKEELQALREKGSQQEENRDDQGLSAEFQRHSDLAGREFPEKQEIHVDKPAQECEAAQELDVDEDFLAREVQLMKEQEARESGNRDQPTPDEVLFGEPPQDIQVQKEDINAPAASVDVVAREVQLMKEQEAREKAERERDAEHGR